VKARVLTASGFAETQLVAPNVFLLASQNHKEKILAVLSIWQYSPVVWLKMRF
jgi:hypothetical protein